MKEEVFCKYCKKIFYISGYRLTNAKTVSCLYCGKRIKRKEEVHKSVSENKEVGASLE